MELDLEIVSEPTQNGLDIVSVLEMKKHLRYSAANTALDDQIKEAIIEAAADFHGETGSLNRTIFPMTWKRHLGNFNSCSREIELPYPPAVEVVSIQYEDRENGSPTTDLDTTLYRIVKRGDLTVVRLIPYQTWPTNIAYDPRAISITWNAGYETYPPQLKRAIKMLAAHYMANPEATVVDRNLSQVSKKVEFGLESLIARLRYPVSMAGWQ